MAFKLFTENDASPRTSPKISVGKDGNLRLNVCCMKTSFKDVTHVELLYDELNQRIAVKPSDEQSKNSFKLTHNKPGGGQVAAQKFLRFHAISLQQSQAFDAQWIVKPGAMVITLAGKSKQSSKSKAKSGFKL